MGVHFRRYLHPSDPANHGHGHPVHWWLLLAVLVALLVIAVGAAGR